MKKENEIESKREDEQSFTNLYSKLPDILKKYITLQRFNELQYDFDQLTLEVCQNAAMQDNEKDQIFVTHLKSSTFNNKQYTVSSQICEVVKALREYGNQMNAQDFTPRNSVLFNPDEIVLQEHYDEDDSDTESDESEHETDNQTRDEIKQSKNRYSWFKKLISCCYGNPYLEVDEQDETPKMKK